MSPQSAEPMSPAALREIADCSPERCHDALEWAADEIERLLRERAEDIDRMERAAIAIEALNAECNKLAGLPVDVAPKPNTVRFSTVLDGPCQHGVEANKFCSDCNRELNEMQQGTRG